MTEYSPLGAVFFRIGSDEAYFSATFEKDLERIFSFISEEKRGTS